MECGSATVSRPQKLDYVGIILYEIDMLDYCFRRLREGKWDEEDEERDYYLCIEGFLLHYRNLIEFFGSHGRLRAARPEGWSPRTLSDDEVTSIKNSNLRKEYHGLISRYLSHCDAIRAEKDTGWKHIEIYSKIEPLLANFRRLFPSQPCPARRVATLGSESVSTATTSSFAFWDPNAIGAAVRKKSDK